MLKIGSLFSGYLGLDMAVEQVFDARTAWVSDIDPGACKILAHRFPDVPNLGDITTIDWAAVEPVDIITGGSPCQDLSHAGRRAGMTEGTRSNLWVSMREAIATIRPTYVIWENVRGAMSAAADSGLEHCPGCMGDPRDRGPVLRALGRVLGDLADLGFDAEWHGLRVADLGGCHGRWRVFVLAWRREVAADALVAGLQGQPHPQGAAPAERHGYALAGAGRPDLTLLPTPTSNLGDNGGPQDPAKRRAGGHSVSIEDAVHGLTLLPTPAASVANDGESPDTWLARRERVKQAAANGNGMGTPLTIAVQLLPTPSVADVQGGRKSRSGDRNGELLLNGIAYADRWGDYAAAIASHERLTGRPAPDPTELGPKGKPRLSAKFCEWMMCLPDGWVTDVPGLTRNEALKALGNGVVPPQAVAALRLMLGRLERTAA